MALKIEFKQALSLSRNSKPVFLAPRPIAIYPLSNDSHYHIWKRGIMFWVWVLKKEAKMNLLRFTKYNEYICVHCRRWLIILGGGLYTTGDYTIFCICVFRILCLHTLEICVENFKAATVLCRHLRLCVLLNNHMYYISSHCCVAFALARFL